jgi:hypothetical protein
MAEETGKVRAAVSTVSSLDDWDDIVVEVAYKVEQYAIRSLEGRLQRLGFPAMQPR